MPVPPKPEIGRTKFKLSQILQDRGVPQEQWSIMRQGADQILRDLSNETVAGTTCEADFDSRIAYFCR